MAGSTGLNFNNYESILQSRKEKNSNEDDEQPELDDIEQAQANILEDVAPRRKDIEFQEKKNQLTLGIAVRLISRCIDETISHPLIVLRRQCQVNHRSTGYCLTPFSVLPTLMGIQRHQGFATLWKGFGSTFIVRGLVISTETLITETVPLSIKPNQGLMKFPTHTILKSLSFMIVTPFYATSLLETLKCNFGNGNSNVMNLNCLVSGFNRIIGRNLPRTTRLLPLWKLAIPTVGYHILHYTLTSLIELITIRIYRDSKKSESFESSQPEDDEDTDQPHTMTETFFPELAAHFFGNMVSDIVLYPLETIMHRLLMQGTRTIIDNTDAGVGVVPLDTSYDGVLDCYTSMINEEGTCSLYKGIGAVTVQYICSYAILRSTKYIFQRFSNYFEYRRPRNLHSS
ncbi:Solute carrier family 25 member 46 [Trichoplax sp. H2]|nr:Solute carrier family 25 member 46 [Trichoplax sp. H2]|eukprot:RDD46266.1 Solute carrier family 25 member 46 [Trichoplax sp. H2]